MAAAIRQSFEQANSTTTAVTTQTASFTSTTFAGSTIVVFGTYAHSITTAASCSDTVNGAYTQATTIADPSGPGNTWASVYYFSNAAPMSAITFAHASAGYSGFIALEVTGLTTSSYVASSGLLQTGITGTTANNLNSGSLAGGAGSIFIIAASQMTTENGSSPYYPSAGTGYTLGGHWFQVSQLGGASLASWQTGTFNNPGSITPTFTTPSGSTSDNFVTTALALTIAGGINPAGGSGVVAWVV